MSVATLKKPRVRLTDTDTSQVHQRQTKASQRPPQAPSEPDINQAALSLTPQALAYALPGGLAKLAYKNWIYAPHLKYIEDRIIDMAGGNSIQVMFSCPPRHGKTWFISRVLPAWYLGRFPNKRVLLITYQQDFSRTQSRHARNIFKAYGNAVFGLNVSEDTGAANQWDIAGYEGGMEAVGAGGAITGKGADLLIIDDLVKGFEEATSLTLLEKRWEWFLTDVYSRIEPGGSVLIIMTRWSSADLIGQIQASQEGYEPETDDENPFDGWETINFPALATDHDVLGRKPGDALFPERYPVKKLRSIKAVQDRVHGSFWFEALYNGNPIPYKGNLIQLEWFENNRYAHEEIAQFKREDWESIIISADTASKETEIADYTVFTIWGIKGGYYYLLDVIRDKMEYPELLETSKMLAMIPERRPDFFLVEDKGSGISLIQDLRKEGEINVWPMDPGVEGKVLRMTAETPKLRAGLVRLPKEASWLDDYLMELRSFPRGKKDQVDSTSQFLKFLRIQGGSQIQMF